MFTMAAKFTQQELTVASKAHVIPVPLSLPSISKFVQTQYNARYNTSSKYQKLTMPPRM